MNNNNNNDANINGNNNLIPDLGLSTSLFSPLVNPNISSRPRIGINITTVDNRTER
jgi:hypothetical protein